jgi:hypothetical protein
MMRRLAPVLVSLTPLALAAAEAAEPAAGWLDLRELRIGKGTIAWGRGDGLNVVELVGPLVLRLDGTRPRLVATLRADRLAPPPGEPEPRRTAPRGDRRVFSSEPFALDALRALDAEIGLEASRVELGALVLERVSLQARLNEGLLEVAPLRFTLAGGATDASVRARPEDGTLALSVKSETKNLALAQLMAQLGQRDSVEASAEVELDLASRGGDSVAGLIAGLNGEVGVFVGEGRVRAGTLDRMVGGVGAIGGALVGIRAGEWAQLDCAVVDLRIDKGVASPQVAVANTANTILTVQGTVDLGRERVDLTFLPQPKSLTLLSLAAPVRLHGRLDAPRIEVNAVSVGLNIVTEAAKLVGTIVYPPALLAAVADLGAAKGCLESTAEESSDLGRAVKAPADAVKGVIEGIGKGLGDLFGR